MRSNNFKITALGGYFKVCTESEATGTTEEKKSVPKAKRQVQQE